ncbi:MAG: TraV family lipoprotein [Gammaproteobacteria bacterium]
MVKIRFLMTLIMSLSLTACATKRNFDCPYQEGAKCINTDEINKRVDSGNLNFKSMSKKELSALEDLRPNFKPSIGHPLRSQEVVAQIWVAPYEDEDGVYHQATYLNTVLQAAKWLGSVQAL